MDRRYLTLSDVVGDIVSVEGLVQELPAVDVKRQGTGKAEAVTRGVHVSGIEPLEQVEHATSLKKHSVATDIIGCSDTLRTWEKCVCKWGITLTTSFERPFGNSQNCHRNGV